jgi:2-(1,2-epoxy-1,2-dihydrophenyl)acetyl-CoA isomerase
VAEDVVLIDHRGPITILTLNRPAKRNALGREMRVRLAEAVAACEENVQCRAVILTGAGDAFCGGGDISEMEDRPPLARRATMDELKVVVRGIARSSKIYVAAVNGAAAGAGFSLSMLCDYVVAARTARFLAAFTRIGLMPDLGLLWSLPNRIGVTKARQLLLSAETVEAPRAYAMGVVDELADAAELLEAASAAAERLAVGAPLPTSLIKRAFVRGVPSLEEALDLESDGQPLAAMTNDHKNGVAAFKERRRPTFEGA